MNTKLTITVSYYKNPETLKHHLDLWNTYPKDIEIIVVDDGSPVGLRAEEVIEKHGIPTCSFQLFRVLVDLPWNYPEARNIGVHHAQSKWVVWIDIDHLFSTKTINDLLKYEFQANHVYSFPRIQQHSQTKWESHQETRLMETSEYIKEGGFDESLSGHYSFTDASFIRKIQAERTNTLIPFTLECITGGGLPDCKCTLPRKEKRDEAARFQIQEWKKRIGMTEPEIMKLPWKKII